MRPRKDSGIRRLEGGSVSADSGLGLFPWGSCVDTSFMLSASCATPTDHVRVLCMALGSNTHYQDLQKALKLSEGAPGETIKLFYLCHLALQNLTLKKKKRIAGSKNTQPCPKGLVFRDVVTQAVFLQPSSAFRPKWPSLNSPQRNTLWGQSLRNAAIVFACACDNAVEIGLVRGFCTKIGLLL